MSREQLVQNHSHGPEIRATVHQMRIAADLFRRHVFLRAGNLAFVCRLIVVGQSEAEVGNLRATGGIEQDIGGLEVAMGKTFSMGLGQRFDDREGELQGLV